MVEHPRSKGCRICVDRRVKCDLTRPSCLRCRKGHRQCPGYPSDIQFRDETANLQKRFGRKEKADADDNCANTESVEQSNTQGDGTTLIELEPGGTGDTATQEGIRLLSRQQAVSTRDRSDQGPGMLGLRSNSGIRFPTQPRLGNNHWTVDFAIRSPSIQQRQLFSVFKSAMAPVSQNTPKFYRNFGEWMNLLATMQDADPLLDTAFRAVSLAHLSLLHHSPSLMYESRKLYVRSLGLLSKALSEPGRGRSSETLSATVMLSFYEMFSSHHETSNGFDAWIKHAGGAGALMKMRGPKAHRHGVDRSMFLAYRNTLVIEAFDTRRPCFLNEPNWRQLAAEIHQEVRLAIPLDKAREVIDLTERVFGELVRIPGLLSDAQNVVALTLAAGGSRFQIADAIAARSKRHVTNLKDLYQKLDLALENNQQAVQECPSVPHDPLFPTRYIWPNVFTASQYIGCWNTLMIMNIVLINYDRDRSNHPSYIQDNVEFARHACRGADYMSQSSFLGPFFVTFALRTCLYALESGQEKQWAGMKLMEIGAKLGMAKTPTDPRLALPAALKKEVDKLDGLKGLTDSNIDDVLGAPSNSS